jgi:hypothetical protein
MEKKFVICYVADNGEYINESFEDDLSDEDAKKLYQKLYKQTRGGGDIRHLAVYDATDVSETWAAEAKLVWEAEKLQAEKDAQLQVEHFKTLHADIETANAATKTYFNKHAMVASSFTLFKVLEENSSEALLEAIKADEVSAVCHSEYDMPHYEFTKNRK